MVAEAESAEFDAKELLRKQAQALLTLFEADCGRAAVTLEEIKEWVTAKGDDHLQFKVNELISGSA